MDAATQRLSYASLSTYCLAGCLMEHFAVFRGWARVPASHLPAVQAAQGEGAAVIYVVPKTVLTIAIGVLLASPHPPVVSRSALWFNAVMMGVSWASSFAVQIPLQLWIRETGDQAAVRRLVRTSWVRVLAMAAHCAVVVWAVAAEEDA